MNSKDMNFRVGIGYDIHRFAAGRKFFLGGVRIPHTQGLLGHSDADVLLHAVCDALLGAAGEDDIGAHFPDTEKRYRGISSRKLLKSTATIVASKGFTIGNIDATVLLERPKIAPYKERIRRAIAAALGIKTAQVCVKATTHEGVGAIGRGEAASAYAVVLIERKSGDERMR